MGGYNIFYIIGVVVVVLFILDIWAYDSPQPSGVNLRKA